jgi:hypothetical protein
MDLTNSLSNSQISLLAKGLSFVPSTIRQRAPEIHWSDFERKIQWRLNPRYHRIKYDEVLEKLIPHRTPTIAKNSIDHTPKTGLMEFVSKERDKLFNAMKNSTKNRERDNLTVDERFAIEQLRNNRDVVIKPADKGGMVVIMKRCDYIREGLRQLSDTSTYLPIPGPLQKRNVLALKKIIEAMKYHGEVTLKLANCLLDYTKVRHREFYLLPKVHKPRSDWVTKCQPKGRPIVSNIDTEFSASSKYLDYFISPLTKHVPTLLKDTNDFISSLKLAVVGLSTESLKKCVLVTGDIEACYPSIPHKEAINTVAEFLCKYPQNGRPNDRHLLELLTLQMTSNDIMFNGSFFKQIKGISMGQCWAPTVCNLYFDKLDRMIMQSRPVFYGRFVDDTFLIWDREMEELNALITQINGWKRGIKLNFEVGVRVTFLDVEIFKDERNCILHRPYFKKTGEK